MTSQSESCHEASLYTSSAYFRTRDWWFAMTAIPLLAATTGPLANVLSIAALVVYWRETYNPDQPGIDDLAVGYKDPAWCTGLNIASLVCGIAGNLFLLFNFTRFVRYIIALPLTIILWFLASGILISITACMHSYAAPQWPEETYSQGFWHAIIAAVLYLVSSLLLMVNMLGYFLGHYTQHFELTDEQRNLILQTMMFFIWLAGGAGVFSVVCGWSYVDALYFCDVTVLTVGFGDFFAGNNVGRGLVFPYSVGGIIMLGLMVSSIRKFAMQLGHDKIVKNHVERRRVRTIERSVGSEIEAERQVALEQALGRAHAGVGKMPAISAPFDLRPRTIAFNDETAQDETGGSPQWQKAKKIGPVRRTITWAANKMNDPPSKGLTRVDSKNGRLVVLREEKDRFMAMRAIQYNTRRFKNYFALSMSVFAFGLLWCVGALVFWICEQRIQGMTYFQGLYFCYVSLLTIGYGDLSPKSNAGKPFFIVWSLIAVPTMTILVSDMGDTVVAAYKRGTFTLAAWTILPSRGFFREFLDSHPSFLKLFHRFQVFANARARRKRLEKGFGVGADPNVAAIIAAEEGEGDDPGDAPTLEELADEEIDEHDLARRLTLAIRRTADHLKEGRYRRYTYEEWVEYTRLIRFSDYDDLTDDGLSLRSGASGPGGKGIVDWDWIGPNSPMMADQSEAEWVLDRLCESLDRYMRKQLPSHVRQRHKDQEATIRKRRTLHSDNDSSSQLASPTSPASPKAHRLPTPLGVRSSGDTRVASPEHARRQSLPSAARPAGRRSSASLGGSLGLLAEAEDQGLAGKRLGLEYRRRSSASGGGSRRASAASAERKASPIRIGGDAHRLGGPRPRFSPRPTTESGVPQASSSMSVAPETPTGEMSEGPRYRNPFDSAASRPRPDRSRSADRRLASASRTIDSALEEAEEPVEDQGIR